MSTYLCVHRNTSWVGSFSVALDRLLFPLPKECSHMWPRTDCQMWFRSDLKCDLNVSWLPPRTKDCPLVSGSLSTDDKTMWKQDLRGSCNNPMSVLQQHCCTQRPLDGTKGWVRSVETFRRSPEVIPLSKFDSFPELPIPALSKSKSTVFFK